MKQLTNKRAYLIAQLSTCKDFTDGYDHHVEVNICHLIEELTKVNYEIQETAINSQLN